MREQVSAAKRQRRQETERLKGAIAGGRLAPPAGEPVAPPEHPLAVLLGVLVVLVVGLAVLWGGWWLLTLFLYWLWVTVLLPVLTFLGWCLLAAILIIVAIAAL